MNSTPSLLTDAIDELLDCSITSTEVLLDNDRVSHYKATLNTQQQVFIKYNDEAPAKLFSSEKDSLNALREAGSCCPEILACNEHCLVLPWIDQQAPHNTPQNDDNYALRLATMLSDQHRIKQKHFGFSSDNYCGATPQQNPITDNGFDFFIEFRLIALTARCRDARRLDRQTVKAIEQLASRLTSLLPAQAPALLHGDLWEGNILRQKDRPIFIDPACYWGWAEADLAMTILFSNFPEAFYRYYEERSDLEPDWRGRAGIYNLYHLLNHLLLFGDQFELQFKTTLKQYQ